ncbi:hypothetical protein V6N13_088219 [Hibiscus sabdariffa]|uniref:Uncharacterized protein n=1 Tax=Hibiscus sabdariffa TaxID=183260 RepID=A0ABR2FYM7_9ROSI
MPKNFPEVQKVMGSTPLDLAKVNMAKSGQMSRNAPCPCSSKKRYKRISNRVIRKKLQSSVIVPYWMLKTLLRSLLGLKKMVKSKEEGKPMPKNFPEEGKSMPKNFPEEGKSNE